MATHRALPIFDPLAPVAWLGSSLMEISAYFGGLGLLGLGSFRAAVAPRGRSSRFLPMVALQIEELLGLGMPLVAVVNIGMGSFLSMQAYFGATFVDGTGAVVGVGLIRNLAPLMVGLTMGGLFAGKFTPELSGDHTSLDREPGWVPDRVGVAVEPTEPIEPSRLAAVRVAAAIAVGPLLTIWGALVGTFVGVVVARSLLGVTVSEFFAMFAGMIWQRDVIGLVVKGMTFGGIAGLLGCHEGLRTSDSTRSLAARACRAASLAGLAILVVNSGWFLLVYHAGPAFGPTLLTSPAR